MPNPQGWYIITYGLGIYVLNLLIGFLSPQVLGLGLGLGLGVGLG